MTPRNWCMREGVMIVLHMFIFSHSFVLSMEKSISANFEVSGLELWSLDQLKPPSHCSSMFWRIWCVASKFGPMATRAALSTKTRVSSFMPEAMSIKSEL